MAEPDLAASLLCGVDGWHYAENKTLRQVPEQMHLFGHWSGGSIPSNYLMEPVGKSAQSEKESPWEKPYDIPAENLNQGLNLFVD